MVLPCIAAKLAQLAQCMIRSIHGRWCRNPQYVFADFYVLFTLVFGRLKYVPFSKQIHMVFPHDKVGSLLSNCEWKQRIEEEEGRILAPTSPEVSRVLPVLVKLIQALSDGLRLQRDCRVSAYVPKGYENMRTEVEVVERLVGPKYAKGRDNLQIVSSNDHDTRKHYYTEHLDGLNWELMVVKTDKYNAYYYGSGRVVMDTSMLDSFSSDAELAGILAHEVGHGVALHLSESLMPLCLFAQIPLNSAFWYPALLRSLDLLLYRRREFEADYIALMLMAAAGYDPREFPEYWEKNEKWMKIMGYDHILETTHPSLNKRAETLRRADVMGRALKIYEQVQAGHGVPSFV